MKRTIDFFFAIGSRYSYLASTQLESLEQEMGCHFDWLPIDSTALLEHRGVNPFMGSPISGQYEWGYRELDAMRWASLYGVPFREPRGRVHFDPRLLALAATAAKRLNHVVACSRALFAGMFVEAVTEFDESECARRAQGCGINPEIFRTELSSAPTAESLQATLERALLARVFGVPSFVVDGQVFWGNDRLILLRNYLSAHAGT